jgi:hypothetical protein
MNTKHPLSGIKTSIHGRDRVIECIEEGCRWESRHRRHGVPGGAMAAAAILVGHLSAHVKEWHPETWAALGGKP